MRLVHTFIVALLGVLAMTVHAADLSIGLASDVTSLDPH
jgi:hypothetical protein